MHDDGTQGDGRMQLDLFLDSRAVTLVNAVIAALAARDVCAAQERLSDLHDHAPDEPSLAALERLTRALAEWRAPAADVAAIAAAVRSLDEEVTPAARRGLGAEADAFIAAFFRDLAEAARDLAYDPVYPAACRAALCLRCADWAGAEAAACAVTRSDETPDALHWLAVARHRRAGPEAARAALFALAWHAPQRLAATLAELDDELFNKDWHAFERASEWESLDEAELPAWFPAWYLLEHPAAGSDLHEAGFPDCTPAQAARLLLKLLDLERRGDSSTRWCAAARGYAS